MKKNSFLILMAALICLIFASWAENDNPSYDNANLREPLYGEWWLVGWNDGGTWLEVDTNYVCHRHLSIEFKEDGYVLVWSMVNDGTLGKLLALNGNEMVWDKEGRGMTRLFGNVKENIFFEDHILDIKSFQQDGNLLKLYYSDDDYFVFTSDFDDSEEKKYEWKNGVADPYIGEVTSISDKEVEVKVCHSPSYVEFYSRTCPPSYSNFCHFAASELSNSSFEVGDKIAFQISLFRRLKTDNRREYQLKVEACDGFGHVTNRTGMMHYDKHRGWIIVDYEVNERQAAIYYYPLKALPEKYQAEGLPVVFSGDLYPTWISISQSVGFCDFYFVSLSALKGGSASIDDAEMFRAIDSKPAVVYDLQGHRLSNPPQKGIYIHDGKKILAR